MNNDNDNEKEYNKQQIHIYITYTNDYMDGWRDGRECKYISNLHYNIIIIELNT